MFGDRFADKLKAKLDEYRELKQIEREAYQAEKCIVDGDLINDKRLKAEQKGIDKAHRTSGGLRARLDRAAERMAENKSKKKKDDGGKVDMITFGSKV